MRLVFTKKQVNHRLYREKILKNQISQTNEKPGKKKWYAVYTRAKAEMKVEYLLNRIGIENYLPLQKVLRQWSDRKKWINEPLLRGYIFVRISNDKEYLDVLSTDHVVKFVRFEGQAAIIPDKQIENIKLLLTSGEELEVSIEDFTPGDSVKVVAGSLRGLEGVLVEKRGKSVCR